MIRIQADMALCQGYGNCVIDAEDVFDVDDDGMVIVLRSTVPGGERKRVEAAVRSCPVAALSLAEEPAETRDASTTTDDAPAR